MNNNFKKKIKNLCSCGMVIMNKKKNILNKIKNNRSNKTYKIIQIHYNNKI